MAISNNGLIKIPGTLTIGFCNSVQAGSSMALEKLAGLREKLGLMYMLRGASLQPNRCGLNSWLCHLLDRYMNLIFNLFL